MSPYSRRLQQSGAQSTVSPGLLTSPPAYPNYTDYPVVTWASLYQAGKTFSDIMNNSYPAYRCYLQLPAGFDEEIVDFTHSNYGIYQPNCMGIWGPSPDQARIKLRPNSMSSASQSQVPAQGASATNPLSLLRVGPNDTGAQFAIHNYGWTLEGTDQAIDSRNGLPFAYNGYTNYWPGGSTFEYLRFRSSGYGNWNSPPGETNAFNTYRGHGTLIRDVEVDGYDSNGVRRGSATASNGSTDTTYENCYFHDSFVSGFTNSTGGINQVGLTSRYVSVRYNANHPVANGVDIGGKNFGGVNHEGVAGAILHDHISIEFDPNNPQEHFFFGNSTSNVDSIILNEPTWINGPSYGHGLLIVHCPVNYAGTTNQITTDRISVIKNGVALTPVPFNTTGDPTKNYMLYT